MITNPYLDPQRIQAALRQLQVRPTRAMGQNFLTDASVLDAIVAAAELQPTSVVVEVGPGLGVLTWELLQQAGCVVSVELDKRLEARLHDEFRNAANLRLVQADILMLTPAQILAQAGVAAQPYQVVANLPYAITSAVLRHFLEAQLQPLSLVVLVQWEVAQRICAAPGDMSVLAHSIQFYADADIVRRVPAAAFLPAPEVDSAVLRLRMLPTPRVAVDSPDRFFRLIKAGFLHARKKLSNSLPQGLRAIGWHAAAAQALAALTQAGIDPQRRAETLALQEWQQLYTLLQPHFPDA